MSSVAGSERSSGFGRWLRTGSLPTVQGPDGLELKFNPWHDPADGRFTFAGAGQRSGAGGGRATGHANRHASVRNAKLLEAQYGTARAVTLSKVMPVRHNSSAGSGVRSATRGSSRAASSKEEGARRDSRSNPVAEFAGGVGEGLHKVGKDTVAGVRSALTTNPVTTVRNANLGIAGMIDAAIRAEDTPARVQIARGVSAVANASARDIGRVTGAVAGNAALVAAPGAALSKVAALRRLRTARPRPTFDPPQIAWTKENIRSDEPWKTYNDTAPGARAGHAPTLMRTMADGSKRPVKFDGIQGDYVIDRKWSISNWSKARAQILRQSQVLAEHRVIGVLEVPTLAQKAKALRQFKKMHITNIHVKVVKP